ncbi:mechanosensitive ion channel family protein [Zooshikella marina]|uniref:mechanosensitive ion channel family protein n=1 Tax=Zooshikella ganghwensis TaxID=202772 RepID=UPI001BAEA8B8|nr:mechanosensitive ion channel family protein [Zooshikella ganghwensis]MBU2705239.1 mechanosensitive ion channel family protein [Zooshikella ganghwensis]
MTEDVDKAVTNFWQYFDFIKSQDIWVYQVFTVVFLTLLANFIARRVLNKLAIQLEKTVNVWDDALIAAARKPLEILIWVIGLSWAAEITRKVSHAVVFDIIEPARQVIVIGLITWFLVRLIHNIEQTLISPPSHRQPMDATTVSAIGKLLRAAVIITAVLVVLQSLGYSISGVLAFGGIGGIAVGFAAKDLLANFFGGLMIYLDRPFKVGDWVRSPDKNIEGTVEHIGWRLTCIRTFDKRPLYVPNSTFTNISVENPSRMLNRRIYETIGVRYDDANKVQLIIESVKSMLESHPDIDTRQTLIVNFNAFGPSSLDFFIYTFTKTTNWVEYHKIKQDILLKILKIIAEHQAEVAFPTQTVHLPDALQVNTANGLHHPDNKVALEHGD